VRLSTMIPALMAGLCLSACCAGPSGGTGSGETDTEISVLEICKLKRKERWGGGEHHPPTKVLMNATNEMAGKKVRILLLDPLNAETIRGPVVVLVPGLNEIPIPEGDGLQVIEFLPEPMMITPDRLPNGGPVSRGESVYTYLMPEPLPLQDAGNRVFYLELGAPSRLEALNRLREVIAGFDSLEQRIDPGPLPSWIREVQVVTWGVDDTAGDLWMMVGKPGTRVDYFALELNGASDYVTLGNGVSVTTIGDLQLADVTIPGSDVDLPIVDAGLSENDWNVVMDTDVGDALEPFGCRYCIETFSQ